MTSINNSLKSFNKSLKKTLKTNFSINSKFNLNKNFDNSLQNFIFFLALALSVGYLVNKQYFAIVLLYIIAILVFMICKNLACSLGISIILTNLLLTLNIFNIKEGYTEQENSKLVEGLKLDGISQEETGEVINEILTEAKEKNDDDDEDEVDDDSDYESENEEDKE